MDKERISPELCLAIAHRISQWLRTFEKSTLEMANPPAHVIDIQVSFAAGNKNALLKSTVEFNRLNIEVEMATTPKSRQSSQSQPKSLSTEPHFNVPDLIRNQQQLIADIELNIRFREEQVEQKKQQLNDAKKQLKKFQQMGR